MRDLRRSHAVRAWWRSPVEVALTATSALAVLMGGVLLVAVAWPAAGWAGWTVYLVVGAVVLVAAAVRIERAAITAQGARHAVAWRELAAQLGRGRPSGGDDV